MRDGAGIKWGGQREASVWGGHLGKVLARKGLRAPPYNTLAMMTERHPQTLNFNN